jgi:hypothetical protein
MPFLAAEVLMHLLFIDESGTVPNPGKAKNKYFVIAGIIVPEERWHKMRDSLLGLKIRRKIVGEIKWRYFAPDNNEAKNPMKEIAPADRNAIRTEIYEKIICSERSIKTLGCVTCVEAAYERPSINSRDDLYQYTYKPLSERFQYHLQDLTRQVGRSELGLVVSDHRGQDDDKRFRAHHEELLHSTGDFISTYKNLVESLFFVPSDLSVGIQLADMVAGAIWRKYEAGDSRWYDLLKPSIRCSKTGEVDGYGIVKFPKRTWK